MNAAASLSDRINLDEQTVNQAKEAGTSGFSLVLRDSNGDIQEIPPSLRRVLQKTLESIGRNEGVRISHVPEELTSTTAADLLGVSRPTLLKWATDGVLPAHKVGSHTRFKRTDVVELKSRRDAERRESFEALRTLDAELEEGE